MVKRVNLTHWVFWGANAKGKGERTLQLMSPWHIAVNLVFVHAHSAEKDWSPKPRLPRNGHGGIAHLVPNA